MCCSERDGDDRRRCGRTVRASTAETRRFGVTLETGIPCGTWEIPENSLNSYDVFFFFVLSSARQSSGFSEGNYNNNRRISWIDWPRTCSGRDLDSVWPRVPVGHSTVDDVNAILYSAGDIKLRRVIRFGEKKYKNVFVEFIVRKFRLVTR